jgi:hypothetical protein
MIFESGQQGAPEHWKDMGSRSVGWSLPTGIQETCNNTKNSTALVTILLWKYRQNIGKTWIHDIIRPSEWELSLS